MSKLSFIDYEMSKRCSVRKVTMPNHERKVYIVNRSNHDFSAAMSYGRLIFLSEGPMNRYSTNNMLRIFTKRMKRSTDKDYIVPCSLNIMSSMACSLFTHKHGVLNLLLFKEGFYIERNHIF